MNIEEWKNLIAHRDDMSGSLVHLTKPRNIDGIEFSVFDVLIKIIEEEVIKGSTTKSGFICGDRSAVCFQEVPLYSLAQNIYYEQKLREIDNSRKIRYLGVGLKIDKRIVYKNGGRPVIYDNTDTAKLYLPKNEWWRIVKLDLNDEKYMVDWTHEREWRLPGDFHFNKSDISIIVPNNKALDLIVDKFKTKGIDIIKEVKGIINISDSLF